MKHESFHLDTLAPHAITRNEPGVAKSHSQTLIGVSR